MNPSDPSVLYSALDAITESLKNEATTSLKLTMAKIDLELENDATYEKVETYRQMIEAELQTLSLREGAAGHGGTTTTTPNKAKVLNDKTQPPPKAETERTKGEKGAGKTSTWTSTWKEPCKFF